MGNTGVSCLMFYSSGGNVTIARDYCLNEAIYSPSFDAFSV